MTLSVGQMTYNGVTLGPGGIAQITSVGGLTGLPNNRSGDVSRPNASGMLAGYDYMGNRPITLTLEVVGSPGSSTTMQSNLNSLRKAFQMNTTCGGGVYGYANGVATPQLTYNFGEGSGGVGVNRTVTARVRKFDDPVDITFAAGSFQYGLAKVSVLLDAVDPLIYDSVQTSSVGLSVATGGLAFPLTFPATFGSQSGGFVYATNSGSVAGPVYITISGPCQNPRIEQQTIGVTVQFNTTLNSGDTLVVDSYAGSAVLNGTASRQNTLAPGSYISALNVQPGSNTFGFYSSDSSATGATMQVAWANTWA